VRGDVWKITLSPISVFGWQTGDGKSIELPLMGDRFDLATAKTPKGMTLEQLEK